MASGSKVTPTLNLDTSPNDESDNDDDNETFLHEMGIVYASLHGNNDARAKVKHFVIMVKQHMPWDGLNGGRTRCWRIREREAY
jgi:hypothetical protein